MNASRRRRSPALLSIWLVRLARALRSLVPRSPWFVLSLLMISLAIGGTWYAWRHFAPRITAGNHYRLDPLEIEITPPPAWIRADVRAEVVRDASLDQSLSILDPALARRVADAFEFHPWVDEVVRVTKLAGPRIAVEVVYRKPVAIVDVAQSAVPVLIPVDGDGVRLPAEDFSPQQRERYPRISGIATLPLIGQRWNDPVAIGAAQLAAALADVWHDLRLAVIRPIGRPVAPGDATPINNMVPTSREYAAYEIVTRRGRRISWGYGPRSAIGGEPSTEEKIARLTRYANEHGGLDADSSEPTLDVRRMPPTGRTASGTPDGRRQK